EWADSVQKLAATFDLAESQSITGRDPAIAGGRSSLSERLGVTLNQTVPMGKLSPLREDETTYHATAVIEKSNDHLKLATVSWRKAPLESWLATAESQVRDAMAVPRASYTLTEIPSGGCIDDTWRATSGPPDGREGHTAVWTGSEMIIWGGEIYTLAIYGSGGRYNPSTDTWTVTSNINAPTARALHTAVWSGSEMIVWGGLDQNHFDLNTGGKYNPQTDSWVTTAIANAPEARDSHTAVWTGNEMIAWGGGGYLNTGGSYNPDLNVWTVTSTVNAPSPRFHHTAVWTGNEMIVWGGFDGSKDLNTGGRYNPATDSWLTTSTTNAPDGRENHTAVWTNNEMIIWGGSFNLNTGGRYNP